MDSQLSRSRLRRVLLVLAICLALVGSACAGTSDTNVEVADTAAETSDAAEQDETAASADSSDSAASEDDDASAEESAESDDEAEEESEEFEDDGEGSPLAELLGWSSGPGDFDEDQAIEEQRQVEASIQLCMSEQGFEYTPRDVSNDMFFGGGWPGEDLSEEEFAAQYGFGFSTTFDEMFEGPSEDELAAMQENPDPNYERLQAMSEGERNAYNFALDGEQPEFDEATGMPIDPETGEVADDSFFGFEPGGCRGEAFDEIYGRFNIYEDLADEFEAMYDRIQADPRIVELATKWSSCMAESGYSYETPEDMYDTFFADFEELQNEIFSASFNFDPAELEDIELDEDGIPVEGSLPPEFFGPPPLSEEQEARLATIQETEIALAVANYGCEGDDEAVYTEVSREYELKFIEENRAVLEAAAPGN